MPYLLSPLIKLKSPGMWQEGDAYEKKNIYAIQEGKLPPVHYDEHVLRPHSLTHIETPAHTQKMGATLEKYVQERPGCFYGQTVVIRLSGNAYVEVGPGLFHWKITVAQIKQRLEALGIEKTPSKLLITAENSPSNPEGYHDPNYVLTLGQEAASFLVSRSDFELYGTSWKSSDFQPGSPLRPIHDTIFSRAIILENLALNHVPEGIYFMSAFPLLLHGASESPVVPVLYTREEILGSL